MFKYLFKNYLYPVSVMAGSIIGVGYLALPYVASQVGILPMFFYFIILAILIIFLNTIFAEISLKTPDHKRFPGFVGFHLGENAKRFTFFLMVFGLFGTLLAYLIVGGTFLTAIFSPIFGGSLINYVFIYFAILAFIMYFDVKLISKIEFWAIISLLVLLFLIFFRGFSNISLDNYFPLISDNFFTFKNFLLPYGAILFALWGSGLIPEVEEMLIGRKILLKRVVIIATLVPAVFYTLFIFLTLGISGSATTDSALVGLKNILGGGLANLAVIIGILTTATAFLGQGLLLKKIFIFDMGFKGKLAWLLTCFVPLGLFLMGFNNFIGIISFIGGIFMGISGIFILLMYKKIGGKSYIIWPLSAIFVLGVIYELFYFFVS